MKLYFATSNAGKVQDAQEILADVEVTVEQLDADLIEPCSDSLEEIAMAKVEQAVEQHDVDGYVMADDSGLFVEKLNGFPGQHTAFFDRKVGKEQLLQLVDEGASAVFRAAIAVYDPKTETVHTFTGSCSGTLVQPRGDGGFGYDPMFLPDGHDKTFAEDPAYKHTVSHRREALEKGKEWMDDR